MLDKFNSFKKTFDDFPDGNVYFLDLKIPKDGMDIFAKTVTPVSTPTFLASNLSTVNSLGQILYFFAPSRFVLILRYLITKSTK